MSGWYPILGWGVFWVALIVGIILLVKFKKFHPVIYLISISLYVFTMGFMIDVFVFGRLGIMLTLIISAIIFMGLGFYFSRIFKSSLPSSRS